MTTKLDEAALDHVLSEYAPHHRTRLRAAIASYAALAAPEREAEPFGYIDMARGRGVYERRGYTFVYAKKDGDCVPVYLHPAPPSDAAKEG